MPRRSFLVEDANWGLFVDLQRNPGFRVSEQLVPIAVQGLRKPAQFLRAAAVSVADRTRTDHVVVSAYPPYPADDLPILTAKLPAHCHPGLLSLIVEDRPGWSRAYSLFDVDAEALAAVVAFSKITGGWDDTSPILVEVGSKTHAVTSEFLDPEWKLTVERYAGT